MMAATKPSRENDMANRYIFACPSCGTIHWFDHPVWNMGRPHCFCEGRPLLEQPVGPALRFAASERHSQARAGGDYYRITEYAFGVSPTGPSAFSVLRDVRRIRLERAQDLRNA
jgi:hypothetical protein